MWGKLALPFTFQKRKFPRQRAGPAPISRFHSNRQTPNYHPRLTLAEQLQRFVSLRRNVPCKICNDDILYPILCSDY